MRYFLSPMAVDENIVSCVLISISVRRAGAGQIVAIFSSPKRSEQVPQSMHSAVPSQSPPVVNQSARLRPSPLCASPQFSPREVETTHLIMELFILIKYVEYVVQ